MHKIKLILFSTLLASGLAHANSPCNGFIISIKNNSPDDLLLHKVNLDGATIQPSTFQKLNSHEEQAFVVNDSDEKKLMNGTFEFHSISLPSKKVDIKFDLKNVKLFCEHNDQNSGGDYSVGKVRLPGRVTYTID